MAEATTRKPSTAIVRHREASRLTELRGAQQAGKCSCCDASKLTLYNCILEGSK
jgi:hypothetical protein